MFRIRRVHDNLLRLDREAIRQVQDILRIQIPGLSEKDIANLPDQLRNPLKHGFRSILFIAEGPHARVSGFALLNHAPGLNFCYLDFIATSQPKMGRGIGQALYERVREEADALGSLGLFYECLPDDPRLCPDPARRKQNAARLRFYEKYDARPIANTAYETPLKPEFDNPPYLVFDSLGHPLRLRRKEAQRIVRAILQRKYGDRCPPGYIDMVVDSFRDDPVRLRQPRYGKKEGLVPIRLSVPPDKRISLVINEQHALHHVRERGYVESPVRVKSILKELDRSGLFRRMSPRYFSERHILSVHDPRFVEYIKRVCASLGPREAVYPYVFPIRNATRPPRDLALRAGYYCIDTFTPLNRNVYPAAKRAADCALTAAEEILEGHRLAYALTRPPGHHAERRSFGGFCYFNSTAIAAQYLSNHGKVAILDVDYHHGNGQQGIFYDRSDVLTISIHGHPRFTYPYFSGFEDETGTGPGEGYNRNYPLGEDVDGIGYRRILKRALSRVRAFAPRFLIIALGMDTENKDPTGTWTLTAEDFEANGAMIGSLHLPMLVVQEGGYNTRVLGINARRFFTGLWARTHQAGPS